MCEKQILARAISVQMTVCPKPYTFNSRSELSYMAVRNTDEPTVTQLTVENVSAKYVRQMFAEKSFCPPLTESYLREQTFTPRAVYELPLKITIENRLRSLQFKLIHNILPTNQRLLKMNVKSSPKCEQCDAPCETTSYLFYECPAVKMFWEKVIDWWNRKCSENINPNPTEVLYGYKPESNSFHTFSHYLLLLLDITFT